MFLKKKKYVGILKFCTYYGAFAAPGATFLHYISKNTFVPILSILGLNEPNLYALRKLSCSIFIFYTYKITLKKLLVCLHFPALNLSQKFNLLKSEYKMYYFL